MGIRIPNTAYLYADWLSWGSAAFLRPMAHNLPNTQVIQPEFMLINNSFIRQEQLVTARRALLSMTPRLMVALSTLWAAR